VLLESPSAGSGYSSNDYSREETVHATQLPCDHTNLSQHVAGWLRPQSNLYQSTV